MDTQQLFRFPVSLSQRLDGDIELQREQRRATRQWTKRKGTVRTGGNDKGERKEVVRTALPPAAAAHERGKEDACCSGCATGDGHPDVALCASERSEGTSERRRWTRPRRVAVRAPATRQSSETSTHPWRRPARRAGRDSAPGCCSAPSRAAVLRRTRIRGISPRSSLPAPTEEG